MRRTIIEIGSIAALTFVLLFVATYGRGASITEIDGYTTGAPRINLNAADFLRTSGPCGSGLSVQTDGCSARDVGPLQQRFGRYSGEVDSQDANQLWLINFEAPSQTVEFSISDMMDMPWSTEFRITAADAVWSEFERRQNGTKSYFRITLDRVVSELAVLLGHAGIGRPGSASNDGFGIGVNNSITDVGVCR
jgi:hypothetical protein